MLMQSKWSKKVAPQQHQKCQDSNLCMVKKLSRNALPFMTSLAHKFYPYLQSLSSTNDVTRGKAFGDR